MTEHLTDDPIRSAFAELHATERAEIVPPGVAAAYRTVRRRRYAATTAAGLTALLVLGGGYAAVAAGSGDGGGQPGPGPAAAAPSADPTATPARVADPLAGWYQEIYDDTHDPELARTVHEAFGIESTLAPGTTWSLGDAGTERDSGDGTLSPSGAQALTPGVSYLVRVACGGTDTIVTYHARYGDREPAPGQGPPVLVDAEERTFTVRCAGTAAGIAAGIGEVAIEVDGDGQWLELVPEVDPAALADGGRLVLMEAVTIP